MLPRLEAVKGFKYCDYANGKSWTLAQSFEFGKGGKQNRTEDEQSKTKVLCLSAIALFEVVKQLHI